MNYYQPRELMDDDGEPLGLFHYSCRNDGEIWPIGPCAEGCPGHPTPDEAREHYTSWALSEISEMEYTNWQGCEVCDAPTKRALCGQGLLRDRDVPLCDSHRTDETYMTIVDTVGDVVASW